MAGPTSKRKAPQPIQVGLGSKLVPVGFLFRTGKLLLRASGVEATVACTFFNTLNGTGWSAKTVDLWGSTMVPLLAKLGVDVSGPVTSSADLYAKYGKYLRAILLVVSKGCGFIGFDLKPKPAEQKELDALALPAQTLTTQAARGADSGSGGGGLLLLGGLAAALLLLKKRG